MEKTNENTIDLTRLLSLLRIHVVAIIFCSLGFSFVGWCIANFTLTPKYTSSAQILVSPKISNSNNSDQIYNTQQANMQLVTTYKDIATSHVVLEEASRYLANPYTIKQSARKAQYKMVNGHKKLIRKARKEIIQRNPRSYHISSGQLASYVSVSTQQNSQVFFINAQTDAPAKSKAVANAVAYVFSQRIKSIMNIDNVTIVSPATDGGQSAPNTKMITLGGFIIGLIVCVAVILARELMNTTIRDDQVLKQQLGLNNLGEVAHFNLKEDK